MKLKTSLWNLRTKFSLFLILFVSVVNGQGISGKIFNEQQEPIPVGVALLNRSSEPSKTLIFQTIRNGEFYLNVDLVKEDFILIVKSNGYINDTIFSPKPGAISLTLKKSEMKILDEVVIVAKKQPFKIREDTLTYKVKGYMDGSESKLEDILKKLPGITVDNNTGLVRYKGKNIETIMLEGDDLFGSGYTIGSRNINADLVEEIEAIENYSDNPLLKGLEDREKVALNLKLKKNVVNLSAEAELGGGMIGEEKAAKDIAATLLEVSKTIKSFLVLSNNNIGLNKSSINYYSGDVGTDKDEVPRKVIADDFPLNQTGKTYAIPNGQYLGDMNMILNLSDKISLKINSSLINDEARLDRLIYNRYTIAGEEIINRDFFATDKKVGIFKNGVKLNYKLSKTATLEYNLESLANRFDTNHELASNSNPIGNYSVDSNTDFMKHSVLYTLKLNAANVLQFRANTGTGKVNQNMPYRPALLDSDNLFEVQNSAMRRRSSALSGQFLGKIAKQNQKYALALDFKREDFLYNSGRTGITTDDRNQYPAFDNDTRYNINNFNHSGRYSLVVKRWKYAFDYKLSYLDQRLRLSDRSLSEQHNLVFEPNAVVVCKISKIAFLSATGNYKVRPAAADYLYVNSVLTDNRTSISATPSTKLNKAYNLQLMYFKNDLYNQFENNLSISYQKSLGNMLSSYEINDDFINVAYFYKDVDNDMVDVNGMVSKFFTTLNTVVKYNIIYNFSTFNNVVNQSDIRTNKNHYLDNEIFIKTSFKTVFNFENSFKYRSNTFISDQGQSVNNNSLNNEFVVRFAKTKAFTGSFSYSYFVPDSDNFSNHYNFVDIVCRYKPLNKRYQVSLLLNNFLNEKSVSYIQTSDISINVTRSSIIPRHFILKLNYKF